MNFLKLSDKNTHAEIGIKGGSITALYVTDAHGSIVKEVMYRYERVGGNAWQGRIGGQFSFNMFPLFGSHTGMTKHGFAHLLDFKVIENTSKKVVLSANDTPETLAEYPWKFEIRMTHAVEDGKLSSQTEITNLSDTPMPFIEGQHFTFFREGKLDDYIIRLIYPAGGVEQVTAWTFENPEAAYTFNPSEGLQLKEKMLENSVSLAIDKKGFNKVELLRKESDKLVPVVSYDLSNGEHILIIWNPTSGFIPDSDKIDCGLRGIAIEPGNAMPGTFPNVPHIKPGETYTKTIIINPH